jgi:hypothetical protein
MPIDFNDRIVVSLEEAQHLRLVGLTVSQSVGYDGSVAFEVILGSCQSSSINFFIADSDKQCIRRVEASRSHHLGLELGFGEILQDPTMLETVLLLGPLAKELNHKVIIDSAAFLLHELPQLLALARVLVDVLLDDFIHVQMHAFGTLRERLGKLCLAALHEAKEADLGAIVNVKWHRLSRHVLRRFIQEHLPLFGVGWVVKPFSIQNSIAT